MFDQPMEAFADMPYNIYDLFNLSKNKFRFISVLFLFFLFTNIQAQEQHFSSTGEAGFLDKIDDVFKISSEKKRAKDYMKWFEEFWESPSTPDQAKEAIIEFSDILYEKKGRAFPDYHLLFSAIHSFVEQDQLNENYETWQTAAREKLSQRRYPLRHFNELLKTTIGILKEQKVFSNTGVTWYSRKPGYRFSYENDTLKLVLNSTKLVCHSRNDSITVYSTGGELDVITGNWQGTHGRVTWERSGFENNKVYAEFDDYTIDMGSSDFSIENVTFYNRFYFNGPLKGSLEHQVMTIRSPSSSSYPKFESHEQLFRIDNIHPNMNYKGGFSQHGAKFRGSGTDKNPATISIFRNDTLFVSAKSMVFALREDEILSRKTDVTLHLDTGEIHHPGLEFKYVAPNNELYLLRSGEGISRSPFFDTYHNVSIDSEAIVWNLDQDFMELRMLQGAAQNHSFFESLSYYRESFFNRLQGMDAVHPLQGLRNCYNKNNKQPFTAKDYARFLNMPESQVRQQIIKLSFHGFVGYNPNTDTVRIQERLTDYLKFRFGKKDYDVIKFKSVTPGKEPNAIFDLRNYDLALNGVESISISDHQNVIFLPEDEKVTLKYNRNFSFNGHILAGMIELFGDGFFFTYDDFRIDMQTIDSMRMNVASDQTDELGRPLLRRIDNTVAKLSGYLQIDTANNKSGILDFPHFPRLVSNRNSFVHYDRPDIQNGAYASDDFYFELDPFEIDSINELSRKNILFDGKLVSNIFPEIEDQLLVRNDFSLGFIKQSPDDGYPIYEGKARFTNEIDLSNKGLRGNGRLEYLTSTAESEMFTFLPEETKGTAHEFNVEPQTTGVEYPDIQGNDIGISYLPFEEQLLAENLDNDFTLYEQETSLKGGLSLSPNGIEAKGTLSMPSASLTSDQMELTHHALIADSADFNLIGGEDMEGVSFKTNNLLAQLDFEERQGRFTSKDRGNKVEFTENRYLAYISEFSWDMDKNDISMGARGSKGNRFVSTHRRQDSLDFMAPLARYDVKNKIIEAIEVSKIEVADADILLTDSIVKIREDAEMDPLESTNIVLNESQHAFTNAHVTVEGKYIYNGYGEYEFVNGDRKNYTLDFHNITVNDDQKTTAEGSIPEDMLFAFDKHFAFKGDVDLLASEPLLTFDGGTQLLHKCSQNGPQKYVRFNTQIDPYNVMIPIEEKTVDYEREDLSHDFFFQLDSSHVYSAFLEPSKRINNTPVVSADGFLVFNDENNSFEIAKEDKLAHPDSAGHILRFHNDECLVSGEGELNLGLELERVKLHSSGTIKHKKATNEIEINAMFGTEFMLDDNSIFLMANAIQGSKAPESTHKKEVLEKRLLEWIPPKEAKNIANTLQPTTNLSDVLPENIQHTLSFTDIEFTWDTPSRSYVANGKANLGWIKNQTIAKQVDVKALISRSRGGNSFEIHIQADPDTWFFYSYNNGKMLILSSIDEFNKGIQALDADERKMKSRLGQDSYIFQLGSNNRLRKFMKYFEEPESDEEQSEVIENNSPDSPDSPKGQGEDEIEPDVEEEAEEEADSENEKETENNLNN